MTGAPVRVAPGVGPFGITIMAITIWRGGLA